jgi:hypothetical protein
VVAWDAHGTAFGVQTRCEFGIATGDDAAAYTGGGFEDADFEAGTFEFVRCDEAGDTRADDGNLSNLATDDETELVTKELLTVALEDVLGIPGPSTIFMKASSSWTLSSG